MEQQRPLSSHQAQLSRWQLNPVENFLRLDNGQRIPRGSSSGSGLLSNSSLVIFASFYIGVRMMAESEEIQLLCGSTRFCHMAETERFCHSAFCHFAIFFLAWQNRRNGFLEPFLSYLPYISLFYKLN